MLHLQEGILLEQPAPHDALLRAQCMHCLPQAVHLQKQTANHRLPALRSRVEGGRSGSLVLPQEYLPNQDVEGKRERLEQQPVKSVIIIERYNLQYKHQPQ